MLRLRWPAAAAVFLLIAVVVAATRSGAPAGPPPAGRASLPRPGAPFSYSAARQAQFIARATAGSAGVLFTKSPGGAMATAARVNRVHGPILAATRGSGVDPALLEGIVFVESAGRPYVVAGSDPSAAAGLTQILAGTGSTLLGMHVDLRRDRQLLGTLAHGSSSTQQSRTLAELARADDRFDPRRALAATVRYLELARAQLGRSDLAAVSYHMGIGNLQRVLSAYDGGHAAPYAQLYFDTAPDRHPAAFRLLAGFGDQSSLYFWRVLGAMQIMRLYRTDAAALRRLAGLQSALGYGAEVLHPPDRTVTFADPDALSAAYAAHTLAPLPGNAVRLGLRIAPSIGAGARALGVPAGLYRGLAPPALALLRQLGVRVRSLAGTSAPLTVQRAVVDRRLQAHAGEDDPPAATGYAFTLARHYANRAQAQALQAVLDRLQALNLIAWVRRPSSIEVAVAGDAARVLAHGV